LNVGPMPNGKIQSEFVDSLKVVGQWLAKNGESIYGSRGSSIAPQPWGVATQKANNHYLHIMTKPNANFIFIPNVKETIKSATHFTSKKVVKFKQITEGVFVYLDGVTFDDWDTVLALQY
jgi:alpha-L-fucosidase